MKIPWVEFVLLFMILSTLGFASTAAKPPLAPMAEPVFDSTAIKRAYTEAEFEFGIVMAKAALEKNSQLSRNDSVFLCKYLAVMMGADELKKENSKFYMHKLLYLDSSATLMNLYASDAIYKMFEIVKTEFNLNKPSTRSSAIQPIFIKKKDTQVVSENPVPIAPEKKTIPTPKKDQSNQNSVFQNKRVWALSGIVLVGVGIGVVTYLSSTSETNTVDSILTIQRTQNP